MTEYLIRKFVKKLRADRRREGSRKLWAAERPDRHRLQRSVVRG